MSNASRVEWLKYETRQESVRIRRATEAYSHESIKSGFQGGSHLVCMDGMRGCKVQSLGLIAEMTEDVNCGRQDDCKRADETRMSANAILLRGADGQQWGGQRQATPGQQEEAMQVEAAECDTLEERVSSAMCNSDNS